MSVCIFVCESISLCVLISKCFFSHVFFAQNTQFLVLKEELLHNYVMNQCAIASAFTNTSCLEEHYVCRLNCVASVKGFRSYHSTQAKTIDLNTNTLPHITPPTRWTWFHRVQHVPESTSLLILVQHYNQSNLRNKLTVYVKLRLTTRVFYISVIHI